MLQCCKGITCHFGEIKFQEQKLKAHLVLVSAFWRVLRKKRGKKNPLIHEGCKKLKELMAGSTVLGVTGIFSVDPRELESGPV